MAMPVIPLSADNPSAGSRTWMRFYGRPGDSLWLLIKGALLTVPTFGFYRFWLITKLRRYLWTNTRIGDDSFEYLGTAKELLLGFVAAVAILAPVYVAYFLLGLLAEEVQAFASIPLVALVVLFVKFAEFRSRRYRLTRTAFRGTRFTMTGSGVRYAALWAGWTMLAIVSLGLALPWQIASLERYKVNNTRWGDLQARFEGTGWQLFKQSGWLWGLSLAVTLAAALIGSRDIDWPVVSFQDPEDLKELFAANAGALTLACSCVWLCLLLFAGYQLRWSVCSLRLGGISVSSNLHVGTVLGRVVLFYVLASLVIAFAGLVLFLLVQHILNTSAAIELDGGDPLALDRWPVLGSLTFVYLLIVLAIGVLNRQILVCGLWRIIMNSIQITNLEVLDTDGRVSRRRIVLLQHGADTLEVVEQGLVLAFWPLAHIRILAAPDRVVRLHAVGAPELSRIEITDRDVSAQLLPLCPNLGGPGAAREAGALRIVAWSVGAVVSLGLVVAYLVPLLAEKLTPIVPVALERRLGAAADNQLRTVLRAKTCNDPAGVAALDSLIERLRASDPNSPAISAEVWSTPVVNAFALPGGGIRIFRGLIENVRSPDELAGVIAHEIGHLKHRDGLRNLLRSGSTGYLLGLFFGDVAGAGVMLGVAKLVLDASYSREAETAADEHAIIILGALGRPTLPLGEFLDRVDGKRERAALLESHPAAKDRRERLRESWRASGPPLLEERQWHALKTLCKSG